MSQIKDLEKQTLERFNQESKEAIALLLGVNPNDIVDNWNEVLLKSEESKVDEHVDYLLEELVKGNLTKDDVSNLLHIHLNI